VTEPHSDRPTAAPTSFRLGYVPGATPAKWVRTWRERISVPLELVPFAAADAESALLAGDCDIAILRPPIDRDRVRSIAVYEERSVVVVSRDHLLAALDESEEVALADLAEDVVLWPVDDVLDWPQGIPGHPGVDRPATTKDAIELVAAGIGVLIVPQSLARLHHRKDVTFRHLVDGPAAPVILAWVAEAEGELTQEFIGIIRGRTANSSRGAARQAEPERPATASAPRGAGAGKGGSRGAARQQGAGRAGGTGRGRTGGARGPRKPKRG
jgi:DNA-binding transcriptional LysR family regulator